MLEQRGNILTVTDFRAGFDGWSPTIDCIVVHLEAPKGPLFMGIVGGLWSWPDKNMPRRRKTLVHTSASNIDNIGAFLCYVTR
jgi:hypothetical protein